MDEMKRKDLSIGLEVELKRGEGFYSTVIVVDTRPWEDTGGNWRFKPRPAYDGKGSGVAVAEISYFDPKSKTSQWRPRVVQLRQLFPKGTDAAERLVRDARRADQDRDREQQDAKLDDIRRRLGIESSWDLSWNFVRGYGSQPGYRDTSRVLMSFRELERLLEKVARLEDLER
jgi:hypothetical protein